MIAHTPTLFAAVALVATILAFCLLLVGRSNRRDNLLLTGCGLLVHALAYVCYTVYAQAPLWVSYGLGNSLLSLALAFYTASLFRVREQVVPWRVIFLIPACMLVGLMMLLDTLEPRMLLATLVLMLQCSMILYWAWRHAERPGRAHLLLQIGALISLIGLGMRVVAVANGTAVEMRYDTSNLKQSISVAIGTATVMMYSIGLVLMAKERSESRLQHLALHDVLTGTFNRRAILERFAVELDHARQQHASLAVAMIDIDHFKRINDLYGHLAGDEVLCHCVRQLQQRLRQGDSLGRYGGEEFLLCCRAVTAVARWLRCKGCARPLRAARRALPVTRSNCASASACGVVCRAPKTALPTCWPRPMRRYTRPRPPGATRCTWRR